MPRLKMFAIVAAGALAATAVVAATTITYTYDARGRLVQVAHAGGPNGGVTVTYAFDKADNRTTKTVTGAP